MSVLRSCYSSSPPLRPSVLHVALSSGNVLTAKSLTDTTLPAVGERPPVFGEGFRSLGSLLATHRDAFSGAPLGLRHAPSSKYSVEVRRPVGHHCTIVYQSSGSAGSHNPTRPPHFLRHRFDPTDFLLHLQTPTYQRSTKNEDVGRDASASATGRRSWMKQSRLVSCQDIPFDHLEEAKTKRHPKTFEKGGRSLPADIVFAIDFFLKLGIPKLVSFRCQQMQVLKSVAKQTSVLNGWILSNAPRPKHVCQTVPNVNIAILCLFCDTINMNHDLGRDFLYGFKLCGLIPDSGSHRVVSRPPENDFQSA